MTHCTQPALAFPPLTRRQVDTGLQGGWITYNGLNNSP